MNRKLKKSFENFKQTKEPVEILLYGELGATIDGQRRVSVANRPSFVYVRLRSNTSEIVQAYNDKVSRDYDLPVSLKREGGRYVIVGRDTQRYPDWSTDNPYIHQHAKRHSFDKDGGNVGDDLAYIYSYQFMPNAVVPFGVAGATNVFIKSAPYETSAGDWKYYGNTGTPSLVNYNAQSSGSSLVLVSLDLVTGNPYLMVTSGTYVPTSTDITQLIGYLPSTASNLNLAPLAFVRLETGTSSVGWSNIYDVRNFLSGAGAPTGTANYDDLYLRLDTSNDPLRGGLTIHPTGTTAESLLLVTGTTSAEFAMNFTPKSARTSTGYGVLFNPKFSPVANVGGTHGALYITELENSTFNVTNFRGLWTGIRTSASFTGTIAAAAALYIEPYAGAFWLGSKPTTMYGLFVGNQQAGLTNNYAIFTGVGLNNFGDQVKIDGSANRIQEIVQGHSTQTANLVEWQTSAAAVVGYVTGTGTVKTSGRRQAVAIKSANYTLTANDEVVVFTANATASLPAATGTGQTYRIVARNCTVTIDASGSETIKGELTQTISGYSDFIITDTATGIWE